MQRDAFLEIVFAAADLQLAVAAEVAKCAKPEDLQCVARLDVVVDQALEPIVFRPGELQSCGIKCGPEVLVGQLLEQSSARSCAALKTKHLPHALDQIGREPELPVQQVHEPAAAEAAHHVEECVVGMTRRLVPRERIDELSNASVPFPFDIHAMITSDDAPSLETALHHALHARRVNLVNEHKEFFRVPLEEIVTLVHKLHGEIEITHVAEATHYRQTQAMVAAGAIPPPRARRFQDESEEPPLVELEPEPETVEAETEADPVDA
jgi:Meiotically up-regulated gene 113